MTDPLQLNELLEMEAAGMRQLMNDSVSYLTAWRGNRRESDSLGSCRRGRRILTALATLAICGGNALAVDDRQPVGDITSAAEAFLRSKLGNDSERISVRAGTLDSRHRLPRCDSALEPFLRRGTKVAARTVVGVRCSGSKPWKIYLPVDVIVTETVWIARRALPRGHLVSRADVASGERDVSRLTSGYISDIRQLLGQRLKQHIPAGRIVTPAMLRADAVIRRGQTVTLTVRNNGLNINMAGKALADGALNQRIRVENSNSGRIIEGIVRSPEYVEVLVNAPEASTGSFIHADPKVSPIPADTQVSNNDR